MEDDEGPSTSYKRSFPEGRDGPVFQDEPEEDSLFGGQSSEEFMAERQNQGLYTILNLPTSASDAEIRERYRSLAVTYHPDRNQDPSRKEAAERHFHEIQRAYEVLTDAQKRTVYDLLGEEGLKTTWEVGHRLKTPEQMRRHYMRQVYEKRQASVEAMVQSKGDISCAFDARAVFLPESFFLSRNVVEGISHTPWGRMQRIGAGQISMKHSFETPLSPSTQVVWQGQMLSRNGAGGGNVVGTVRHQFSPRLWIEAGSSVLYPRVQTAKAAYTFDQDTFATVNAVQQTVKAPPSLTLTLGRRIYGRTTGFLTAKTGFYELGRWGRGLAATLGRSDKPTVSLGLTTQSSPSSGWTTTLTGGAGESQIAMDYSVKILDGLKVKIGASFGMAQGGAVGINAFLNGERQITETTRCGMGVTASLPGGISMRFRFFRLGQKVVIPVMLSQDINPTILFFSTVLPSTAIVASHYFYFKPRRIRRTRSKVQELQKEHAEYLEQKKAEALEAIALMDEQVQRKVAQERSSDGLIIISAYYGLSACFTENGISEAKGLQDKVTDVTIPIQALVNNGHLSIPGGRAKFNLLGFYDPCMGEPKTLRIQYLFRSRLHEVTIDDLSAVRAPLRAHAKDGASAEWTL